jgi:hypothetical protein
VRPVGCWGPKDIKVAVEQSSGRNRLNIHGAIDLETGQTRMLEAVTVDAASTLMLLMAVEAMYPGKRMIHLGVVQNPPFVGYKGAQKPPAREGRISVRTASCAGRRPASPHQTRRGCSGPRPSSVSQCGWPWPVINSRGLLPLRSASRLRMKHRWFKKN